MKEALIIFTKNPVYGKVKTRLATSIGPLKALGVHNRLAEYTSEITNQLNIDKFVFYSDSIVANDTWNDAMYQKRVQSGNDLGEKMSHAIESVLEAGYKKTVIIGTDCPQLTYDLLLRSFRELDTVDVVVGPAKDGGYYLLGVKKLHKLLFSKISWSTSLVLSQTIEACKAANISIALLDELMDIDTEEDLVSFARTNSWIHD